ncbi:hypothetical protein K501DRAFT_331277, partial [Backusella circina FSU 941]
MTSVNEYGLNTVINTQEFENNVVVKECPTVGRSLVAKRALIPGDVVLVENPLIKYRLKPECRSSASPYYSKKLWKEMLAIVKQEEGEELEKQEEQEETEEEEKEEDNYSDDYSDDYSSDEESDDEAEVVDQDSDFCPGVPAAMLAYLDINPPQQQYNKVRKQNVYEKSDFDFFYYPEESDWLNHDTVKLIHSAAEKVVASQSLYQHVDAKELAHFVLKIYSNAHTVSIPHSRTESTHKLKQGRREMYKSKFGDSATFWGDEPVEQGSKPTIALLRWGSKFAHSCSPNMFLQFEPSRNAMVFTVIKPLAAGDILSFSYLPEDDSTVGGLVCGTTINRQAKLEKYKFFKCACERCMDWDWSRGVVCKDCKEPVNYRDQNGEWTCFSCDNKASDNDIVFIGDREDNVQQMIMGFASRINGNKPMSESMMRMMEPYLDDLLEPAAEKNLDPVPRNHWTYGFIHSLLAVYHLSLFPQSFGKGLASQLGLTVKGLEEALVYIEFLENTIRTHKQKTCQGNPMAAFFAGWRILSIVIDLVMSSTENKYANVKYERDSDDSDNEEEDTVQQRQDPVNTEPVLIPMDNQWIVPVKKIADIVSKQWSPLVEQVFAGKQSPVIHDMLNQIKLFVERIEKTSNSD